MTTNATAANANGVAMSSETARSLTNPDGTETVVYGTKFTQVGQRTMSVVSGKGGTQGRPIALLLGVAFDPGVDIAPIDAAQKFASEYIDGLHKVGVTSDELTQELICGLLVTIDKSTDAKILEPFVKISETASGAEISDALDEVIKRGLAALADFEDDASLASLDKKQMLEDLKQLSSPNIGEHLMNDVGLTYTPSEKQVKNLAALYADALSKAFYMRDDCCLLFAGYGPDEYMPSLASLKVVGVVGTQVIHSIVEDDPLKTGRLTRITTTAQDSAEDELLHGISGDDYSSAIELAVTGVKAMFGASKAKADEFGEKFSKSLGSYFNDNYTRPFLRAVGCMDAPGLARVVDLLSRAQELRSACSNTQSTVGGVIEVLTITKAEGIRWHRRLEPSLDGGGSSVLG